MKKVLFFTKKKDFCNKTPQIFVAPEKTPLIYKPQKYGFWEGTKLKNCIWANIINFSSRMFLAHGRFNIIIESIAETIVASDFYAVCGLFASFGVVKSL